MKNISGRDASLLALLARVPDQMKDAEERRSRLLGRLSTDEVREIGQAVLADEEESNSYSKTARATAIEIKKWARSVSREKASVGSR